MATSSSILSKLIKNSRRREADPLRPLIDEYILKRDASHERLREFHIDMVPRVRPGGRLSPSSLAGCMRQAAYKFAGVRAKGKVDPDKELIFDDGNWRHHKWDAIFMDMEKVLGPEKFRVIRNEGAIKIPELYIAGNFDNDLYIMGKKYMEDTKGINKQGFTYLLTNDEPVPEHVRQLITYMRARNRRRGILFYDCKDNQETKAFVIQFEHALWAEVEEWAEDVIALLQEELLPPMHHDCEQGNFIFERCPYAYLCYGSKTDDELRTITYRNFPGVEEAWKEGHRRVREAR